MTSFMHSACFAAGILLTAAGGATAQHAGHSSHAGHAEQAKPDSAFAALQARGQEAMGVDQYTSIHRFDSLVDGGRIELQRDTADADGVATIRAHLRDIATRFAAGDFAIPGFVHAQKVPGAAVMAAQKDAIRYVFRELPGGGEVRITTTDAEALRAIHQFMEFQRSDHRAEGHH